MSPEVVYAKLELLHAVLSDLKPHITASRAAQEKAHYEIERQVQLSVDLCTTLARRMLLWNGVASPATSRDTFEVLAKKKVISRTLASSLSLTVGLRNLLVHEYGKIDYDLFFSGLKPGYSAFVKFAGVAARLAKQR